MADVNQVTVSEIHSKHIQLLIECPKGTVVEHSAGPENITAHPSIPHAYLVRMEVGKAVSVGIFTVTLIEFNSNKARLGFTPDKEPIHRREVWEAIQRANADASE